MTTRKGQTFEERIERVETLIETVQRAPNPALRNSAEELVQTLLELHGAGLERMLELTWDAGETGKQIIREHLSEDDLVSSLLLLHGLHPLDLKARVQRALDKVRPYMESHGGDVEVLDVRDGIVRLRLQGNCESCPASAMTLKYAVEDAIYEAAPDALGIETVDATEDVPHRGTANGVRRPAPGNGQWHEVEDLLSLDRGGARTKQVSGRSVLFLRLNGDFYAYDSTCPACHRTLEAARVADAALACPHCGQTYDAVRAGQGVEQPDLNLTPFPLLVEQDRVKVALPA